MDKSLTQGCNPNNSDDSGGLDVSPEFLRLLEATVLAAGKYVVPSEDLRPHTLEAAKAMDSERKGSNRFLVVSAVIAFCLCICWPVSDRLSPWRENLSGRTLLQIQERALRKNMGPDFGLIEVFLERQKQVAPPASVMPTSAQPRSALTRIIEE